MLCRWPFRWLRCSWSSLVQGSTGVSLYPVSRRCLLMSPMGVVVGYVTLVKVRLAQSSWSYTDTTKQQVYTISVLSSCKFFKHLSTVCIGLTLFAVNARETNNAMFEPHESDLSYPLSLLHVKTSTLRFSSNPNPNQMTAVSVDFWSEVEFSSDIVPKLTEQALA